MVLITDFSSEYDYIALGSQRNCYAIKWESEIFSPPAFFPKNEDSLTL